jgi:D-aminopeptidase
MRARDLGITIGTGRPGSDNAITDVAGVRVGHATLVRGDAVRTGVTVLFPSADDPDAEPAFAGCHRLNGNGELTGLEWVRESGLLTSPVAITNTHSVGVVRDALIAARLARGPRGEEPWSLPVVGETWDGTLNDIDGMHVRPEHVVEAIDAAAPGPVREGNVGGGTGMICHGFKGGIGTASRVLDEADGGYTVEVLVQANHGRRERLRIEGVPVGEELSGDVVPEPEEPGPGRGGSIIIVAATDAPCSRTSATAWPSGPGWAWPAPAARARTPAVTSSSPWRPATGDWPAGSSPCRSGCWPASASTRCSTPSSRPPRRPSSTRWWPPRP